MACALKHADAAARSVKTHDFISLEQPLQGTPRRLCPSRAVRGHLHVVAGARGGSALARAGLRRRSARLGRRGAGRALRRLAPPAGAARRGRLPRCAPAREEWATSAATVRLLSRPGYWCRCSVWRRQGPCASNPFIYALPVRAQGTVLRRTAQERQSMHRPGHTLQRGLVEAGRAGTLASQGACRAAWRLRLAPAPGAAGAALCRASSPAATGQTPSLLDCKK
jgi:hypothetical protein